MSFILDALKKSEKKYQKKGELNPRMIYEPVARNGLRFHPRLIAILILLLVSTAFLFWFLGSRQRMPTPQSAEVAILEQSKELIPNSSPTVPSTRRKNTVSVSGNENQPLQPEIEERSEVSKPALIPRNENQVYRFNQLPISIQKQIPPLHMSLHAYNRRDASASMVQLNEQMMREGDIVVDNICLEKITAEGVVLHYDRYHFLLPK